jgi:thymidylate synthase ThyX
MVQGLIMHIEAKIIEHSISLYGVELVTYELKYPRFIHSEFMTHRVFSRNASSSRAIPVAKMLEQVRTAPAKPIHWGKNQPGMQANEELDYGARLAAEYLWDEAAKQAAATAEAMQKVGVHKQVANRILEPFQWISVIVTATEWDNFFNLRAHKDAQPEIRALAECMRSIYSRSLPRQRLFDGQVASGWHLPYVTTRERAENPTNPRLLAKLSAARCARVSYLTHDGQRPSMEKDLALYDRLVGSKPLHASPVEHQAYAVANAYHRSGNFRGWWQHRKMVEAEHAIKENQ